MGTSPWATARNSSRGWCRRGCRLRRGCSRRLRRPWRPRLRRHRRLVTFCSMVVPSPVGGRDPGRLYDRTALRVARPHPNYLEAEARNRSLGRAGEDLVLLFEHERLWRAGHHSLADRIEHVARTQGDGLGYDIRSFEVTGQARLIEVKTTRFGAHTPFFVSRNEVQVSEERHANYQLYRLFSFRAEPRLFTLEGSLRSSCQLEPFTFSALPN